MFSNNYKINFIFKCLIICNYTLSYIDIQVRRRIGISSHSLDLPFGVMPVSILQWHSELEYSTPNMLNILLNLNIGLMSVLEI